MADARSLWRVLGASVPGSAHLAAGRGCDDAHAWRVLADGTLLLAAADGAGSAPRGAEGAACAVHAALDSLTLALLWSGPPVDAWQWERLLRATLGEARAALTDLPRSPSFLPREEGGSFPLCTSRERGLQQFATTLLVAVVTDAWVAAAHIGDGAIVLEDTYGPRALTLPEHGEYQNETVFLTSESYRARAQIVARPRNGTHGIALLTDGLEGLALNLADRTAHVPFFVPLFAFAAAPDATAAELAAFLASPRVCAHTDDDKTLLLAVQL